MINFLNNNNQEPFVILRKKYEQALSADQQTIEAISVSSYDNVKMEVDSRYVNLKFVCDNEFIFFTNYNSPKAKQFASNNQVAVTIYWSSINIQIRMKAKIVKTSIEFNQNYFAKRDSKKNALAISSHQSNEIISFEEVTANYGKTIKNKDLTKCPDYWGGFSFKPYEIEFWEGSEFRLNKREKYSLIKSEWHKSILEP